MNLASVEKGGVHVVSFAGKMDRDFLASFEPVARKGGATLLDLGRARDLKGDDLEDLVRAHNACLDSGGTFALANLPPDLATILEIMQLDLFFTVFATVEEGVQSLGTSAGQRAPVTTIQMIAFEKERILGDRVKSGEDPEALAKVRIERVKVCIRYIAPNPERIALLEVLAGVKGEVKEDEVARATGQDPRVVGAALARLVGLRVLTRHPRTGALHYRPGPDAREAIEDILRMWGEESNRAKLMEWARPTDA